SQKSLSLPISLRLFDSGNGKKAENCCLYQARSGFSTAETGKISKIAVFTRLAQAFRQRKQKKSRKSLSLPGSLELFDSENRKKLENRCLPPPHKAIPRHRNQQTHPKSLLPAPHKQFN
ncbi:MAG: hypothetical protein IK115_03085, partial [Lachnospiraceae bacterium]|nr:hypothetical protein [Lachnospiraceae bacterium]